MEYMDFFAATKRNKFKRVYLLHGDEEYVKQEALRALITAALGDTADLNLTKLTAPTSNELIMNCDAIPFMGDRRIVVCDCLYKDKDAKTIIAYLDKMPEETILVFMITGKADSKGIIFKYIQETDGVIEFTVFDDASAAKWIGKRATKADVGIEFKDAVYLVSLVGHDMQSLKNETDKLCDYVGQGGTITRQLIPNVVIQNPESQMFTMYSCFINGRLTQGFRALEAIVSGKNREDEAVGIAGYIARCLKNTLIAYDAIKDNCSKSEIESRLDMRGRTVTEICTNARKFPDRNTLLMAINDFSGVTYARITGRSSTMQALRDAIFRAFSPFAPVK